MVDQNSDDDGDDTELDDSELDETAYLLSSPANAEWLLESMNSPKES